MQLQDKLLLNPQKADKPKGQGNYPSKGKAEILKLVSNKHKQG